MRTRAYLVRIVSPLSVMSDTFTFLNKICLPGLVFRSQVSMSRREEIIQRLEDKIPGAQFLAPDDNDLLECVYLDSTAYLSSVREQDEEKVALAPSLLPVEQESLDDFCVRHASFVRMNGIPPEFIRLRAGVSEVLGPVWLQLLQEFDEDVVCSYYTRYWREPSSSSPSEEHVSDETASRRLAAHLRGRGAISESTMRLLMAEQGTLYAKSA